MSYWKSKVVPKLKKMFEKGAGKKKGASAACKLFDSSKESFEKELGEKNADLHPKVIEIYRSTTVISKKLLKEPNEPAVKENPDAVQILLQELAKAGFPGAQVLSDAGGKYGPALLPGPIVYLFEKTSTFLVEEPLPEPKHEAREIPIEDIIIKEKSEEPKAAPEDQPAPIEIVTPVEEVRGGPSSEEKKVVSPIVEDKKEESIPVVEAKKDEPVLAVVEPKKEVVAPRAEAVSIEAKKEVPPPIDEKKEAVAPAKEEKKEDVATFKDTKKEEASAAKEAKKEEVKPTASKDEKKEKPKEITP